jgi:TDG/mug DNA glycosylase family protein
MPSHRVRERWMGEEVETLEDLLQSGLRAICVGVNPSPVSVASGHYYQGRIGQRFFRRLRAAGVLPAAARGHEDDIAFAAGVGFTDIVKRPTPNAKALPAAEFEYGRQRLIDKLETYRPELVIFTFKKTAQVLLGSFHGNGFLPDLHLAHSDVFVMPGPYESADTAAATMRTLAKRFEGRQAKLLQHGPTAPTASSPSSG